MFFKKGTSSGFFKKVVDAGHLGMKVLSHPVSHAVLNSVAPNSGAAAVSGVLQKIK